MGFEWESDDFVLMTGECGARLGIHHSSSLRDSERVNLHFEVKVVDQTYQNLRADGLEFALPPKDTDWGYRTAVIRDPAGHSVELFTRFTRDRLTR